MVTAGTGGIGVIGGTGPLGRGLGLRWALAGRRVLLGSRDRDRAQAAAEELGVELRARLPASSPPLRGGSNADAATCDVVVVAVPFQALGGVLPPLSDTLAGKLVVSCVNPLAFDATGPRPLPVPAGSAAEEVAGLLPGSRVVGAFQHIPAAVLQDPAARLDGDVLLTGDDPEDKAVAAALTGALPGLRALDAGPLRLSAAVEGLTAVLIAVNRRYRVRAGIRLTGLGDEALHQPTGQV